MRRSHWIFLGVFALLVTPLAAHAAGSGLFNPIIPTECTCTGRAPDYGCVFQVVQNGMNLFVSVATVIITLFIALAGFTYMTSGDSAEKRQLANKRIINAVLGLAIVLCAYLLVDGIMKTLYDGNNQNQSKFGPWNSILAPKADGSDLCLTRQEPPSKLPDMVGSGAANNGAGGNGVPQTTAVPNVGSKGKQLCGGTNTACSVQALQSAGLSQSQAQAMSCIAVSESSGNPDTPKSSTGACGTYQITTRPGNWSNPAFHGPGCSVNTSCNDRICNMQTAIIMLHRQGYQPWTGKRPDGSYWNPTAVACVSNFDPGH
jgi:hypothetical protein